MQIRFTVLRGKDAGQIRRFRLEPGQQIVIGRHEDCDFPLWDEAASRRHALLELNGAQLTLVDLGSSNGTFVNGEPADRLPLSGGERVRIGETEVRIETEGFQKRETVVIKKTDYTVESSLSPADVDLATSVARDAAGAARLNTLLEFVDQIQAHDGGEPILADLLEVAVETLDASGIVVPSAQQTAEPLWSETLTRPSGFKPTSIANSIVEQVLSEGNALQISDTSANPLTRTRESIVQRGVTSILSAPIRAGKRSLGVLYLESRGDRTYNEDDLAFIATLAKITGMALVTAEKLQTSRRLLKSQSRDEDAELVTRSERLRDHLEHLSRFAASGGPVLIFGETGSGKELLARYAHRHGLYREGPFVPVNCAAIPATLLESELFGHEKGAFTGATARKAGMFELANGGTLFLDEIGELPHELQPKLLRVLETGEFFRIGGRSPVSVQLLIVSATNRDLEQASVDGTFREDLFFRLNRFRVVSPPLRERPEDITLLARHFLHLVAQRLGGSEPEFAPDAVAALEAYSWPGNVRELRNVVERAVVVANGDVIRPKDLLLNENLSSSHSPTSDRSELEPRTIEQVEEEAIRVALHHTGGKKGEAAEILGIAWPTLRRKLKKYEIDPESPLSG
ncbi:MAG: sigma 54-interacting transcriptional regulator [Planctomycetota bacterium]